MASEVRTAAVTGSQGFLGSHMADFLEKKGYRVYRVKRGESLSALPKVDEAYHFAANHGGVGYISSHEYEVATDNARLDLYVIDWARRNGVKMFYPSSSCIYPDHNGEPQGVYGYEKLFITKLSEHAPFMRVGILGTVYGPRQHTGEKAKFPVDICKKVWRHSIWKPGDLVGWSGGEIKPEHFKPLEIWGDGKQVRSFLYVDDAIEMIYELMCADHYHGPVNIASEEQVTVKEITDALCKHAGVTPHYVYDTSKPSGAQERREDVSAWKRNYSYRPQTSAAEGFAKLYDHLIARETTES